MTLDQWDWAVLGVGALLMALICLAVLSLVKSMFRGGDR